MLLPWLAAGFIPLGSMLKDYGLFHALAIILFLIVIYQRFRKVKGGEN